MVNPVVIESLKVVKSPLIFFALVIVMFTIILTSKPILTTENHSIGFAFAIVILIIMMTIVGIVAYIIFRHPRALTETEEGRITLQTLEQRFGELQEEIEGIKGKENEDWYSALKFVARDMSPFLPERRKEGNIILGAKDFPESKIISEIIAQLLEKKLGKKVQRNFDLGGSLTNFLALKYGYIDLYIDYTGTGMHYFLDKIGSSNPNPDLSDLRQFFKNNKEIEWLDPIGKNLHNDWEIIKLAKNHKMKEIFTLEQLRNSGKKLTIGGTNEFLKRNDGIGTLVNKKAGYGINFNKIILLPTSDRNSREKYLREQKIDVVEAQVADTNLHETPEFVVLEDNHKKLSRFYDTPLIRTDIPDYEKSEIVNLFEEIKDKITNSDIRELIRTEEKTNKKRYEIVKSFIRKKFS